MNTSTFLYALGALVFLALADFFLKVASTRISNQLGTLVYAGAALIVAAIWVASEKFSGADFRVTAGGLIAASLVGVCFALVVVFLSRTFSSGGDLSVAAPAIRLSALVLASALGITILGEQITWRWVFGVGVTFVGVYFIVTR
ncbi:MAG: hypothetical protein HY327_10245 [Chloroflexi bacterium]|nr:hypothetical protein [Chloroflexota bacterium]